MDTKVDPNADLVLSELSRVLPGKPPYKTLWRWCKKGIKSRSGRTITLECVRLPGGEGSSVARFRQFIDELQG